MAHVYRVNINFYPLLNTFYCRCIVNTKRFKSQDNAQKELNIISGIETSKNQTFDEMIKYRQDQAHKSIIVKLHNFDAINQLETFCARFGQILNIFPYTTINNHRFILIEFNHNSHIKELRRVGSRYFKDAATIHTTSPLFEYKHKKLSNRRNQIFPLDKINMYSNFIIPPPSKIVKKLKKLNSVSEQMISLYNMLQVSELDIRLRFYTAEELTFYLSRLFVNLIVVPFGSSVNGFGQKGCDLDLLCKPYQPSNVNVQNKHCFHYLVQPVHLSDREKQKQFLDTIFTVIRTCIPGISQMQRILNARVPILKFNNVNTNMQCDLSSTNLVALYMAELLYIYGELDYRVRPLVCTIRKWAQVHSITRENPGHWITNFSLTLLIVFYLQTKSILPSIITLKSLTETSTSISKSPWFKRWESNNNDSLDQLLYGFFEYYSIFDFKVQAICVREGKIKEKRDSSPVYIYNPFELSLNVSKNISILELARILDHFQNALQILVKTNESPILRLLNFEVGSVSVQNSKSDVVDENQHQNIKSNTEVQTESNIVAEKLLCKTSNNKHAVK